MNEAWTNDEGNLYFVDVSNQALMLVIEYGPESYTCSVSRRDVETLVEFLSEWCGFPLFINDTGEFGEEYYE